MKRGLRWARVLSAEQYSHRWPSDIVRVDITKRFPWRAGSVDSIYSSHTFEHLSRAEVAAVLDNCLRALRPGGVLRLVLPDLEKAVARYLESKEAGDPSAADQLVRYLELTTDRSGPWLFRLAAGTFHRDHRWMYDAESMMLVLRERGWSDVTQWSFRLGDCPDLERVESGRENESFYVEARRPS